MQTMFLLYVFATIVCHLLLVPNKRVLALLQTSEASCIRDRLSSHKFRSILCDMDGTLLTDRHEPSIVSVKSIENINRVGYPVIPATGRSRKSVNDATCNLFPRLFKVPRERLPGIYSQGLQVYAMDGSLVYERYLESEAIAIAVNLCHQENMASVACAGDEYFCEKTSSYTNKLPEYHEPLPQVFSAGLQKLRSLAYVNVNKLLIMAEEDKICQFRQALEGQLRGLATVTKAVPGMLEILPLGASKGDGVRRFLDHEGIDPSQVLAFGDGENDIEVLKLVKVGVAMGNAKAIVKENADLVTLSNNDGGVGHVLDILHDLVSNTVPLV